MGGPTNNDIVITPFHSIFDRYQHSYTFVRSRVSSTKSTDTGSLPDAEHIYLSVRKPSRFTFAPVNCPGCLGNVSIPCQVTGDRNVLTLTVVTTAARPPASTQVAFDHFVSYFAGVTPYSVDCFMHERRPPQCNEWRRHRTDCVYCRNRWPTLFYKSSSLKSDVQCSAVTGK